jgi:regulator of cell morphogenesis and NO signaling
MTTVSIETTIGEIVRASAARSRIFEHLGIEYCCGGKKSLAEACDAKGLDPKTVLALLTAIDATSSAAPADANAMSLSALCDHIQLEHHDYLREELPRLDLMSRKVAAVHGHEEPRLLEIRTLFELFAPALAAHIMEEEVRVFPIIRTLEAASPTAATKTLTELRSVFANLEDEHSEAGASLARFRELTNNYSPPEWACNTFRALYAGLADLEFNMHQHVHKENNVLFPKALAVATAA